MLATDLLKSAVETDRVSDVSSLHASRLAGSYTTHPMPGEVFKPPFAFTANAMHQEHQEGSFRFSLAESVAFNTAGSDVLPNLSSHN